MPNLYGLSGKKYTFTTTLMEVTVDNLHKGVIRINELGTYDAKLYDANLLNPAHLIGTFKNISEAQHALVLALEVSNETKDN